MRSPWTDNLMVPGIGVFAVPGATPPTMTSVPLTVPSALGVPEGWVEQALIARRIGATSTGRIWHERRFLLIKWPPHEQHGYRDGQSTCGSSPAHFRMRIGHLSNMTSDGGKRLQRHLVTCPPAPGEGNYEARGDGDVRHAREPDGTDPVSWTLGLPSTLDLASPASAIRELSHRLPVMP